MKKYVFSLVLVALFFSACTSEESTSKKEDKIVKETKKITNEVTKVVTQTESNIDKQMEEIVSSKVDNPLDKGKQLFLKCAGCHGQNAEKQALGKSQIIKGWTKEQIKDALLGYKNSTYGGPMKGVMKSQVIYLSEDDINKVSEYISQFK